MAVLAELGQQSPCSSQGVAVDLDTTKPEAGEILEFYLFPDRELSWDDAQLAAFEVAKIKNDHPHSVIHYVKIEPWKITVQYSIAPVGQAASPAAWLVIVIAIGTIIMALLGVALTHGGLGWIWAPKPPTGDISITARNEETEQVLRNVRVYVDGEYIGRTDGGSILAKDLAIGDHQVSGEILEDYDPPEPTTVTVVENQTVNADIWYCPSGYIPPPTGFIFVATYPVDGPVYIDGIHVGTAPDTWEVDAGLHTVSFGLVEGYVTPAPRTADVRGGKTFRITDAEYKVPGAEIGSWIFMLAGAGLGALGGAASGDKKIGIPVGAGVGAGLGYVFHKIYEFFK